jgi:aminopeptidase N
VARIPFWLKATLLVIPGVVLFGFLVLIAIGWHLKNQLGTSGGPLPPSMAAYDVRHYDLEITVVPKERTVRGSNTVTIETLQEIGRFEIHLDDRLAVDRVEVDGRAAVFDHDDGIVRVRLTTPWRRGERHAVTVGYRGRPKRAIRAPWIDGFVWSETASGEPWVGVTGEGDGGDNWWPCKDHPSDEPDEGMDIALTVPGSLVGLANGRPMGETRNRDGTVTSRWRVGFPINNYGVTLNIGPYRPVEAVYNGVDGDLNQTVVFWANPEQVDDARRMWPQVTGILEIFGRRFGEYPFLDDKLWVAHAPYYGMEHQTLIAYGASFEDNAFGFDELLLHELAHEWWGNKITASDWGDLWLHEGFASYAEALFVLDTLGEDRYLEYMQVLRRRMTNRLPVIQGSDLTAVEAFSPDVYGKGAWVLHMLRLLMGNDRFFAVIWDFADGDDPSACRFATTDDFTRLVESKIGRGLDWFWRRYLHTAELPEWRVSRRPAGNVERIAISWDDPSFEMPLPVEIDGEHRLVAMPGGRAELTVPAGADVVVDARREVLAVER